MEDVSWEIISKQIKDPPLHKMHFYDIKDTAGLNEEHTEAIKLVLDPHNIHTQN